MLGLPRHTHRTTRRKNKTPTKTLHEKNTRTTPRLKKQDIGLDIQDVHAALSTLRAYHAEWPANEELRETKKASIVPTSGTINMDALPYGLDRTADTDARIRTREGAQNRVHNIRHIWSRQLDQKNAPKADLATDIGWLLTNLQRSMSIPEKLRTTTWSQLVALAKECRTVTGHGSEPTVFICPTCKKGTLEKPYTSEGIASIMVCSHCGEPWTQAHHEEFAFLAARLTHTGAVVSQAEAAMILGLDIKTVHARVKRRGLEPVSFRGKRAYYCLDEIK